MTDGHIVIGVIVWVVLCVAWTSLMVGTVRRIVLLERRVKELEDAQSHDIHGDVQP